MLATRIANPIALVQSSISRLEWGTPALDLLVRVFVASVFFKAGLTKIASWETTLALFENEYAVPLLPVALAAFLATAAELAFPVMLVLGLGTRIAALGLFVLNAVAVISYPEIGEVGLKDHQHWGLLLLVSLLHGPGALSLDHLIGRRFGARRA
ncbi:DoxX family protein [Aquabacterium humicola]|uniref:DoxX family protein n=1 Tax=Aquabacterium humicola TaxID=3237377 RepID=UPI002543C634|nr:DoxX family protein [Rubrivivax pictus]